MSRLTFQLLKSNFVKAQNIIFRMILIQRLCYYRSKMNKKNKKKFKFPDNNNTMQRFLGLINSLRRIMYLNIRKELAHNLLIPRNSTN